MIGKQTLSQVLKQNSPVFLRFTMSNVSNYDHSARDLLLKIWQIANGTFQVKVLSANGLKENLIANLNRIRRQKYRTDVAMAEALRINEHTLRAYLRGTRTPPLEEIERIAQFYGYSGQDLFADHLRKGSRKAEISPEMAREIVKLLDASGLDWDEILSAPPDDD